MRVLFCARHFGAFRNYETLIAELAGRGHDIHLAADVEDVLGGQALVERLAASLPGVTWGMAPSIEGWLWQRTTFQVRHGLEAVRFAARAYDALPKYRHRSAPKAPWLVRRLAGTEPGRRVTGRVLRAVERGIPPPPALVGWLRDREPEVVLLASVTNDGAPQMDHLKAALSLGMRTSLPIYSWDHLSGKAPLHIAPHQVLVWNDTQRREAVDLHGLPADRLVVTGAYGYEPWLSASPSKTRTAFLEDCGLDPAQALLVYVCSVLSRPAPPEAPFVLEWVRALRASGDPRLQAANVIVRPHPERLGEWDGVDLTGLAPIAVRGRNPIDAEAKAEYFDTLHHAAAVVGIVTSAFIEAAAAGRPALTIEAPRFVEHQRGAPHYHYLRDDEHGLLVAAPDLATHAGQLAAVLSGADGGAAAVRASRFVDRFVRPPGGAINARAACAAAVEALAGAAAPRPQPFGRGVAGLCARTMRLLDATPILGRSLWNDHDRAVAGRDAEARREKDAIVAGRREYQAREDRERAERERLKAVRAREKQARIDARERGRAREKEARLEERRVRGAAKVRRERARQAARERERLKKRLWRTARRLLRLGS
ncbi:MAG: hypothetical protein FJW23_02910 [Acidimicrobiia bacterium]|nr:hypothetical protein [Acidimicrobiia bacterium]